MTRTAARGIAVQLIYALSLTESAPETLLDEFFAEDHYPTLEGEDASFAECPDERQLAYIRRLVGAAAEHREALSGYIEKYARGWRPERISKTAAAILRCAMCEVLYLEDVPPAAALNEAVELAKGYDEPETVAFVNGVLGGFMRGEIDPSLPEPAQPGEGAETPDTAPAAEAESDPAEAR